MKNLLALLMAGIVLLPIQWAWADNISEVDIAAQESCAIDHQAAGTAEDPLYSFNNIAILYKCPQGNAHCMASKYYIGLLVDECFITKAILNAEYAGQFRRDTLLESQARALMKESYEQAIIDLRLLVDEWKGSYSILEANYNTALEQHRKFKQLTPFWLGLGFFVGATLTIVILWSVTDLLQDKLGIEQSSIVREPSLQRKSSHVISW